MGNCGWISLMYILVFTNSWNDLKCDSSIIYTAVFSFVNFKEFCQCNKLVIKSDYGDIYVFISHLLSKIMEISKKIFKFYDQVLSGYNLKLGKTQYFFYFSSLVNFYFVWSLSYLLTLLSPFPFNLPYSPVLLV